MICLSWNYQELENPRTVQKLCLLAQEKSLQVFFLVETKSNAARLESIRRKLGFVGCLAMNVIGRKEGLALLWKGNVTVDIINFFQWHIFAWVDGEDSRPKWSLTSFIVNPTLERAFVIGFTKRAEMSRPNTLGCHRRF